MNVNSKIPSIVRFGTSSWTYPSWRGTIYFDEYKSEKEFNQKSLGEYSKNTSFKTVGIDSSFYRPPSAKTLQSYKDLVPSDFLWISKVWEDITAPIFPKHPRYGSRKGEINDAFLNSNIFIDKVLEPYSNFKENTGPFVFQFPTISEKTLKKEEFFAKLEEFLAALPKDFRYATEIRNPNYLTKEYFSILNECGATHCFNHWNYMPPLKSQMQSAADAGGLHANFYVSRLLTPLGLSYEEAVKLFTPYDKVQRANESMRADVVCLAKRGIARNADTFIIVNNRSEGYAPGTIKAIQNMLEDSMAKT